MELILGVRLGLVRPMMKLKEQFVIKESLDIVEPLGKGLGGQRSDVEESHPAVDSVLRWCEERISI